MKTLVYNIFYIFIIACDGYTPPETLELSISEITTPYETNLWLDEVLEYESDTDLYGPKEFWAPCSLTYKNKSGDCDDQVICAAAILNNDVDYSFIVSLRGEIGHAAFIYAVYGQWGVITNISDEFRNPQYTSLHEAVYNAFGDEYFKYRIYDYDQLDIVNGDSDLKSQMKRSDYILIHNE